MAGGQPFSMENLHEILAICREHDIQLMLDMTRIVENAWFIQQNEDGYGDKSIKEIIFEIASNSDGCTMSSKKDNLVNCGGFMAMNDEGFFTKAKGMVVKFNGLHTYGGMSGRDMEALLIGIREGAETDEHIAARIRQTHFLGRLLSDAGIPLVRPFGGHAIFIDARVFLDHLPQDHFPAQALASEIYVESGVRTMERGIVSAGRDKSTGENKRPALELVRITIPRRVYLMEHMMAAAEGIIELYKRRHEIQGLKFTFEPEDLRFFQAMFEQVPLTESAKEMERQTATTV
jgi:tyrosine phenol-lyase